jgi:hypothetical protein
METGTAITAGIIILICLIPILYVRIKAKRQYDLRFQILNKLAEQDGSTIGQFDQWKNTAIGLSQEGRIVYALRVINGNTQNWRIHLDDMRKCRLLLENRTVEDNGTTHRITEKIALVFTNHDAQQLEQEITFYNFQQDSLTLANQLTLAEKWCALAQRLLAPGN